MRNSDLVLKVWIKERSEWKSHKNPKTAVGTGISPSPYTGDGKTSGIPYFDPRVIDPRLNTGATGVSPSPVDNNNQGPDPHDSLLTQQ
ncbi:hypothetical protein G6514_005279 [Epicoccum nigrum]|nr:hypothetical protein G6514_005279 [Epicoccum nigrum]